MWLILSLSSAFFAATKDAIGKSVLKNTDEYLVTWSFFAFSAPPLAILLFFIPIPSLNYEFWLGTLGSAAANIIAFIAFFKSLKRLPLSFVVPLEAFVPLLLSLLAFITIGERMNARGLVGVALVVLGTYLLNLQNVSRDILAPFKKLVGEKKNFLVLVAIICWTFSALFDKIAVQNSSPLFYLAIFPIIITLGLSYVVKVKSVNMREQIRNNYLGLIAMSILGLLMDAFYLVAINSAAISYVSAARSLNFLFAVGYGYLIFNEGNIKQRFLGATLMTGGVVMLALA